MDENLRLLARLVGPCPTCGNGRLEPVSDGELVNFFCATCRDCWHPEMARVHRVDRTTCPGCPRRSACLAVTAGAATDG